MTGAVADVLGAVATVGLADGRWPDRPPGPSDWPAIRQGLDNHRLLGLAALAVESGRLVFSDDQRAELARADAQAAAHTVTAEAALLEVSAVMDDAGVPFRVLKGSAAAQLDWSVADRRRWVDTDVLVAGDDLARAVALMEGLGARRRLPELRQGFDRRFAKSVTMAGARSEIDLHRSLVVGPHCFLVRVDDLWDDPRPFQVCGRLLWGLPAPVALVHYAMHATITGAQRLGALRDVIECARQADLDAAAAVAHEWKATAVVQRACGQVPERLGLPNDHPLVRWGAALRPTVEEHQLAGDYEPGARQASALARASLRYVPGVLGKARYAYAVAWPSKANRAARQRSASDQAAQLSRHLRGSRP
jgi:hypothetical protein